MKKRYILALTVFAAFSAQSQVINFPDPGLKSKLLAANSGNVIARDFDGITMKIDANSNGEIEVSEALQVGQLRINNAGISNLDGINNFANLTFLDASDNNLTTISLNGLTDLKELQLNSNAITALTTSSIVACTSLEKFWADDNPMTSADVSNVSSLKDFSVPNSQLTYVNVAGLSSLTNLDFSNNQLPSIDLTGLVNLEYLSLYKNQLTQLDVTHMPNLGVFHCHHNNLTSLQVHGLQKLVIFDCSYNDLTELDFEDVGDPIGIYIWLSDNLFTTLDLHDVKNIDRFYVANNPLLESINLKNGSPLDEQLNFSGCPNLHYICQDDSQYQNYMMLTLMQEYNMLSTCTINSYCSFVPEGDYYSIVGKSRFDLGGNGCDVSDPMFPHLKFQMSSAAGTGGFVVNESGNYNIPVQAATHTITPILENPEYFNISPTSAVVTFPTQTSPFTQDFCFSTNGVHPDLEVVILPLTDARPGFDALYKIVYKNKGSVAQSGSLSFSYNDSVLDLVTSNPAGTNVSGTLSWNFSDLIPFESREIMLTFNVNTPMETPPVTGGTILPYSVSITSAMTDEMPTDNTFALNQVAVNAFDPNDKKCLEGATISPEMVGKYVHYMVRFENTGTANATNVVVKDWIDPEKFDLSSLVAIGGSHSFITRISPYDEVEFIFENIGLPFDDASNDGYVAFKIKTKPTLVVGDTFSNSASIYFDYNFPIVTDPATTTVQLLGNPDFDFSDAFALYPNPAKNTLNIHSKNGVEAKSVSIYNMLGQLLQIETGNTAIDVSDLRPGTYFVKVFSDKGTASAKFIRE